MTALYITALLGLAAFGVGAWVRLGEEPGRWAIVFLCLTYAALVAAMWWIDRKARK